MRQKLNENPLVQAIVLGVLALIVGFIVFTRVVSTGAEESPVAPEPSEISAADPAATAPATTAPATGTPAPEAAAPTEAAPPPGAGDAVSTTEFVAGKGLPPEVVKAYAQGDVVVLLIVRGNGSDDLRVKRALADVRNRPDTTVIVVRAVDIANYSRITQGVNVNRTPALVVIEPRDRTEGPVPRATVAYGFRGRESVNQAVRDALYTGKENLPYYP